MNKGRNVLELDMQRNVVGGSPEALRKAIKLILMEMVT